jgi:hypothetical protein
MFAAFCFDSAMVLGHAIKEKGSRPKDIQAYLNTVTNYKGVTGKIAFDKSGDSKVNWGIGIYKNGKLVPITSSGNKTNYPFSGNWQGNGTDSEGNEFTFAAKVSHLGDNRYQMLILDKLDTQKKPMHIIDGVLENNKFPNTADEGLYKGNGTLSEDMFEGYYKGPVDGTYKMWRITAPALSLIKAAQQYQKAKSETIVTFLDKLKTANPDKLILHAEQIQNSNDIIVLVYDEERKYAPSVPVYVFNNNYFPDGQKPTYNRNINPKTLLPLNYVRGVFMGVFSPNEVVHGTGVLVEYHKDLTTLSNPDLTTEFNLYFH